MKKEPLIVTLDTETRNGLLGELKRIAIYFGEYVKYGYTFADVEPMLINLSYLYDVHIYIHNAEFDIRKIPELFDGSRVDWKNSLFINGKVSKLKCKDYTIHDSFKILPSSLAVLSGKKGYNVEHGKLNLWDAVQERYPNQYNDIVDFLDRCNVDDTLYLEYLGYDVIALYEVLQKVIEICGVTTAEFVKFVSTASLSRYLFKKGYNETRFAHSKGKSDYQQMCQFNWSHSLRVEEFIRTSYCGGRTEVFKPILNTLGYHMDVNSLYPFVMYHQPEYPVGEPSFYENGETAKRIFELWLKNHDGLGFLNCTVYIPYQNMPPLPVKMGKLAFPCGHVYGTFTYEELEYAIKDCGVQIKDYHAICHFEKTYPVFEKFIGTFYQLKEQATIDGNIALRTFAKLVQNVGYGYTGMRRDDKTSLDSIDNLSDYDTEQIVNINPDYGFIEIRQDVDTEYIQVQIASYVTSRARLVWLKAARDVERRGGRVYYGDTDSIVSDIPFDDSIVDKVKLGYWDCESNPIKALFLRPKVYCEIDQKEDVNIKFKGVSKEVQKTLDFEFYKKLLNDIKDETKKQVVLEDDRVMMRSLLYMQKNALPADYYEKRTKHMNLKTIEKRVMDYENNETYPLYFDSIQEFENFSFTKSTETYYSMKEGKIYESIDNETK